MDDEEELTYILLEASRYKIGAVVSTNAPERLRQKLTALQKRLGLDFTMNIPGKPGELWLVKKD